MARITMQNFKDSCEGSGGNQSLIAQRLECTRQAVSLFIQRNKKAKTLLEDARGKILDKALSNVDQAIVDGDLKTSQWYLERKSEEFKQKMSVDQKTEHSGTIGGDKKYEVEVIHTYKEEEEESDEDDKSENDESLHGD